MKNLRITPAALMALVVAAALGVVPGAAQAANSANFTATITAVPAISVIMAQNMNFSNIVASAVAGTVSVPVSGTNIRTITGGVVLGNASGVMMAQFLTQGAPLTTFAITVPTTASLTGPGAPMTLNGFTLTSLTQTTDGSGQRYFNVGATLNVNANQVSGTYTTTFPVTVAYN